MSILALLAAQIISAGSAAEPIDGFKFLHNENGCEIEGPPDSHGAYLAVTRPKDSSDNYLLVVSNPAWSNMKSGPMDITVEFNTIHSIYDGPVPDPVTLSFAARKVSDGSRSVNMLAYVASKEELYHVLDWMAPAKMISFVYNGKRLTDWMYIPKDVQARLQECDDPFAQ